MIVGTAVVTLYLGWIAWAVATERRRTAARNTALAEQDRVRHEQHLAERRLQQLTREALQGMLDAGRRQGEVTGRESLW